uniref:hypothetical protein n=1 Tax=Halopseudomonas sp. TaxID=2901191 RepID=UPI00311DE5D8
FMASSSQELKPPRNPGRFMEKAIAQAKVLKAERDRLALENKEMAPKAVVFENCVALRQESLATFVRTLEGVNTTTPPSPLSPATPGHQTPPPRSQGPALLA